MAVLFDVCLSPHPRGFGSPCVHAVPAVLSGVYDEASGEILAPDLGAVRDCLPAAWRKAFDRAHGLWTDERARLTAEGEAQRAESYLYLDDSKGRQLARLSVKPRRFNP